MMGTFSRIIDIVIYNPSQILYYASIKTSTEKYKKLKKIYERTVENSKILLSTGNNDYGHKTINQFGSLHFSYR